MKLRLLQNPGLRRGLAGLLGALAGNLAAPLPAARAELAWERTVVNLPAAPAGSPAAGLEARFPFVNAGGAPVEITNISTSCGCTTAELPKRRFEAGERGEIVARFEPGERVGHQEKTVTVETADGAAPTNLSLVTDIPELVRVHPAFVFWLRGEALTPKTLLVETSAAGAPAAPTLAEVRVESSSADILVETRAVEPGRRYELVLRPAQTDRLLIATLRVACRFEPGAPGGAGGRTLKAYASIKPTPTPPPPASAAASR